MAESSKKDIIVMAMFTVTRNDILACADELGMSEELVTDDMIETVKGELGQRLGDWRDVIKDMVKEVIKNRTVKCPLDLVCSPSCAWREVGGCMLPKKAW